VESVCSRILDERWPGFLVLSFEELSSASKLRIDCSFVSDLEAQTPQKGGAYPAAMGPQAFPQDVLAHAFEFLLPSEIASVGSVARSWMSASLREALWEPIVRRRFGKELHQHLAAIKWQRWRDYFLTYWYPCRQYNTDYGALLEALPRDEARYVVYNFGSQGGASRRVERMFCMWVPLQTSTWEKMEYASCMSLVRERLMCKVHITVQATELEELSFEAICDRCTAVGMLPPLHMGP